MVISIKSFVIQVIQLNGCAEDAIGILKQESLKERKTIIVVLIILREN